jgi:glycerophosphoryl diester phosphodiesterase
VLVVLHDDTLDRTTGGACSGPVIERTLAELRACDVGSWFNALRTPDRSRGRSTPASGSRRWRRCWRATGTGQLLHRDEEPGEAPGMEEALLELLDRYDLREPARRSGAC